MNCFSCPGYPGTERATQASHTLAPRELEIQSGQLALSKQADADTKRFAEKMVHDHLVVQF